MPQDAPLGLEAVYVATELCGVAFLHLNPTNYPHHNHQNERGFVSHRESRIEDRCMTFWPKQVLILVVGLWPWTAATALTPCISATSSANGNVLVINKITYEDPDETRPRAPLTSSFLVFPRLVSLNGGTQLNAPGASWADPIWSVVFTTVDKRPPIACPYTLVSDDAEYLILVGDGFLGRDALSIYRRRDHLGFPRGGPGPDHGVPVRQIPLTEMWDAGDIPEMITDGTPQWYAGGSFAFTPDNRTLIHKTRWRKTFMIDLETGKVTQQ
jgi:hypothetical protein